VRHRRRRFRAGQYWFGGRSRVSDFPGVREVGSWIGVWEFVCEDF
jgi:hypothetical protein